MRDYNIIPDGWHQLSGFCDCQIMQSDIGDERLDALIIRIDEENYLCYKDPCDGYRSLSELRKTDKECTNTFPPQRVMVKHYDRQGNKGIEFYSPDFDLILLIGTDNYDDYYPCAVYEWHPEHLPINKGIHKPDYMMPGELTVKVQQLQAKGDISVGEITDIIDKYYQASYLKGRESFAKEIKEAIGCFDDYGKEWSRVGDYISALDRVIEAVRNIDKEFMKEA